MMKATLSSVKYEIRALNARIKSFCSKMCFWQWKTHYFQLAESGGSSVKYIGRTMHLPLLKSLLSDSSSAEGSEKEAHEAANVNISVYEFPTPNTLRIPYCLSTVVTLDKPIEEILASYSRSLRRSILKQLPKFRYEKVTNLATIEDVDRTMLRPYATARNGDGASQVPLSVVKDLALNDYGQLDLLYEGDKSVGCHLGNSFTRRGQRYWHVNRFGYTEETFSDYGHLQDVNSANLHLALVAAIDNGYDYCDYGPSLARPGAGLIEWKRRRKGFLAKANSDSFYVKVPNKNAANFFWGSPLFSLNGEKVSLHLGIPDNKTDEELAARYREMGYDGLTTVHLMCAREPSEIFVEMVRNLYKDLKFKPKVIVKLCP